jgi:hypothetical protein
VICHLRRHPKHFVEIKVYHYLIAPCKIPGMSIVLPALAVAFAAICVWLTVRVVNRRERWAKWTAVAIGLSVFYVASFGPACWLISHLGHGGGLLPTIYHPLLVIMRIGEEENERLFCAAYSWDVGRPERVPNAPGGRLARYASLGSAAGWHWRYEAIYTIRKVSSGDARIRLRDEAWEWSNRPWPSFNDPPRTSPFQTFRRDQTVADFGSQP